ncbi:class I adenylate cyclase [Vibrio chagasii]|nr:class I adenylate cyclase [Vibrio chagasii]
MLNYCRIPKHPTLEYRYQASLFADEPDLYGMDSYLMLEKVTRYLERINDHTRLVW